MKRPEKDDGTRGALGRKTPGAFMTGKPPTPGDRRAESPAERAERLRRIARGQRG